jgi:signal transduction histidine kinase
MRRYRLRRYLGIIFIAVVIGPAIVLSLIALRAISHEEAYIEKQIEGTLSAEVAHVAGVLTAELERIQAELAGTVLIPDGPDPGDAFEEWKQRSPLVEIPFLLSPEHEILWPTTQPAKAEEEKETGEASFLRGQQAFLENEEQTPVYENIAEAYKDDILAGTRSLSVEEPIGSQAPAEISSLSPAASDEVRELKSEEAPGLEMRGKEVAGDKARAQKAVSQFVQSEPVRQRVYDKARQEGQQFAYRNVKVDDAVGFQGPPGTAKEVRTGGDAVELEMDEDVYSQAGTSAGDEPRADVGTVEAAAGTGQSKAGPVEPSLSRDQPEPESLGRIRSMFISQPRSFGEIVAGGESGIVPRTIDGGLQLLYWQKAAEGNIVGCLIKSDELRDRLIGVLPAIYSSVRILTILDEEGSPIIVPAGQEWRDWQQPLAAGEISELLPRWEVATYLTHPDVISSRAQVATSLMWVLIVILFVAILVGGTLVVRSTYSEMRLAQQKTSFVANVSHELKTPLTSIRLFAEMLRDGRQHDEEKQRQYLDIMAAETERLTRLVNNVLDFSRMERGEKRYNLRPCDLVKVCTDIVETQRARLENNGFEVIFTTHAGSLFALADEEALKQALVNLISNAEKYSPETRQIGIDIKQGDGSAVIAVSDRGIGIPSGEAGRIFDEFYRVDDDLTSRVKGAGLGLTIARRILQSHGGDLRYSRREGGGSTFELVIPLQEELA